MKTFNYSNCIFNMKLKHRKVICFVSFLLLLHIAPAAFACSCVGRENQTTESELAVVDLAVKGKIISVSDYHHYDTATLTLSGQRFDSSRARFFIRNYRVFTLVVDHKFKGAKNMSDTIKIVTGMGGGDCGYDFEVGRDYIVYGDTWKNKLVKTRGRKMGNRKIVEEVAVPDWYYTDICRLTQESNEKELQTLKSKRR
jgi:hypothetical protein